MALTLILTDGITSVNLNDVTNFELEYDWAPRVARRRLSQFGGRLPYLDTAEQLPVIAKGATGAAVMANIDTIGLLLDQAERWGRGHQVNAVVLQYKPNGSGLANPLQALVRGAAGDEDPIELPIEISGPRNTVVPGNTLNVARMGAWTGDTQTSTTSAQANVPSVHTVTFSQNHKIASPLALKFGPIGQTDASPLTKESVLLFANDTAKLALFEAEGMIATGYTSLADANARGGAKLVYTPTSTATAFSGTLSLGSFAARRVGIFAVVRSSTTSVEWALQGLVKSRGMQAQTGITPFVPKDTNPEIIALGEASLRSNTDSLQLAISATTTTGTPKLEIDYLALVGLDDECAGAVVFAPFTPSDAFGANDVDILVQYNPLTDQAPLIALADTVTTDFAAFGYRGSGSILHRGTTLVATLLAVQSANWTWKTTSSAVETLGLTASRFPLYLSPR